ncbi:MAG: hypothetical protein KAI66_13365 [Lentisphaeria bacterium]|nr:hypothetical protein [Lentisphaeria bacterium]
MKIPVQLLKLLYCVCRQAERSIDFAIQSDQGLERLRAYYEGGRLLLLQEAMTAIAGDAGDSRAESRPTTSLARLFRLVLLPPGLLLGWRWFSRRELHRLLSTLVLFHSVVRDSPPPTRDELIELRMSLHSRQVNLRSATLIANRLEALAQRTEHFGQNDRMEFMPIDHLLMR